MATVKMLILLTSETEQILLQMEITNDTKNTIVRCVLCVWMQAILKPHIFRSIPVELFLAVFRAASCNGLRQTSVVGRGSL